MTAPAAGWYPAGHDTERFWDGQGWTAHTRRTEAPDPATPSDTSSGQVPPGYPAPGQVPPGYPAPGQVPPGYPASGQVPPGYSQPGQAVVPQYGYAPVAVAPKSPAISVIASFFLPGLGQFINGDTNKGVAMLAAYLGSFVLMVILVGFITAPIIWIWSMVDAYQSAQAWNLRYGIVS